MIEAVSQIFRAPKTSPNVSFVASNNLNISSLSKKKFFLQISSVKIDNNNDKKSVSLHTLNNSSSATIPAFCSMMSGCSKN